MTNGFIRYEVKNGVEYASVYKAKRIGEKKTNDIEWLGRVIDKEKGLYKSRNRGVFSFSLNEGVFEQIPEIHEKLILDFGDAFFFDKVLNDSGYKNILMSVFEDISDTVLSLVYYRSLQGGANCYAGDWWDGSYARILYPKASLSSQRISETLKTIGDEAVLRSFFEKYLHYISSMVGSGVLIDSTGLPNDIRFPLTEVNNHGGEISNEARLVLVLDRESKMPIYFRYVAGNIVDVTTLETTLDEVKMYGMDVYCAIVDAGYYSEKNVRALQSNNIAFVMRMVPNRKIYKDLVQKHAPDIEDAKHLVRYRDRFLYIKRIEIDLFGKVGYAYISEDIDRKHDEIKKYMRGALDNGDIAPEVMNVEMKEKGLFILISSEMIEVEELLPLYYTRQAIEQVFDINKNNSDLLPLRVHSIEGFRGHLLLSFIASAAYIITNKVAKKANLCALGIYRVMRNLKCKVYDEVIIVQEANKKMNDIAKNVGFNYPSKILFSCGEKIFGNYG
jgi:hypothetical protein